MYVSVTGLKPKGFIARIRFWITTLPASRAAQMADGILFCDFKTRNGYHHTLTVWKTKKRYDGLQIITGTFEGDEKHVTDW